jgi:hypothetical protein
MFRTEPDRCKHRLVLHLFCLSSLTSFYTFRLPVLVQLWKCWDLGRVSIRIPWRWRESWTYHLGYTWQKVLRVLPSGSNSFNIFIAENAATPENIYQALDGYCSVLDQPPAFFPEQLYNAYPDAKFILVRNPHNTFLKLLLKMTSRPFVIPTVGNVACKKQCCL